MNKSSFSPGSIFGGGYSSTTSRFGAAGGRRSTIDCGRQGIHIYGCGTGEAYKPTHKGWAGKSIGLSTPNQPHPTIPKTTSDSTNYPNTPQKSLKVPNICPINHTLGGYKTCLVVLYFVHKLSETNKHTRRHTHQQPKNR